MRPVAASVLLLLWTAPLGAWHVDAVHGDDANPGTAALPFRTVSQALAVVTSPEWMYSSHSIYVAPGVYDEALGERFPWSWSGGYERYLHIIGSGPDVTVVELPAETLGFSFYSFFRERANFSIQGFTFRGDPTARLGRASCSDSQPDRFDFLDNRIEGPIGPLELYAGGYLYQTLEGAVERNVFIEAGIAATLGDGFVSLPEVRNNLFVTSLVSAEAPPTPPLRRSPPPPG